MTHAARDGAVGVIGLGLMGTAFAQRLIEHGYQIKVWNRTRAKADPLLALGAAWSDHPLRECDRTILSLYTSDVVDAVMDEMRHDLRPGQLLLDTTTGEPNQMAALGARLAGRGVHYLDAPVSGSSDQARRGDVTILVGGAREGLEACCDLLHCLGQKVFHVGPCGSGARMKLVSNLVLGLNRAALAEGLAFAAAIGLDPKAALDVLVESVAYSRTMDTKGAKMLQGDFRAHARLSQHLKDVRLILDLARENGMALPLSEIHRKLLERCEADGYGDADNSAVIRALAPADALRPPHFATTPSRVPPADR